MVLKHGYYKVSQGVFDEVVKTAVADKRSNVPASIAGSPEQDNLFYIMRKKGGSDAPKFNKYCKLTALNIAAIHDNDKGFLGTDKKAKLSAPGEGVIVLYVMPIKSGIKPKADGKKAAKKGTKAVKKVAKKAVKKAS